MKAKALALVVIYAALYTALSVELGPLSYGQVNVRLANIMVALIPLLGWAGAVGQGMGVLIANFFGVVTGLSPLGWIDLLNAIPSFVMAVAIWKLRNRNVLAGTVSYSVVLAITVGFMLSYVLGLPLLATCIYVLIGNLIATTAVGYPIYKAFKKTGFLEGLLGTRK
jgi:uncharacterized membrane protein